MCKEHPNQSLGVFETRTLEQSYHLQSCKSTWCHTESKKTFKQQLWKHKARKSIGPQFNITTEEDQLDMISHVPHKETNISHK